MKPSVTSKLQVFAALCAIALAAVARGQVIVNGSFEADPFSPFGTLGLGGAGGPLTGWQTKLSPDNTYPWGLVNGNIYNAGPASDGRQWVIVGDFGQGGSWIQQTVGGFTIGQTYTLNFDLASEFGNPNFVGSQVDVSVIGATTTTTTFTAPLRGANYWDTWATFSDTFVADSTTETFRFEGDAGPNYDPGIDNVRLSGNQHVPDQGSTLLLLGTGILAMAGFVRRRR
jgi:hypothetical protein